MSIDYKKTSPSLHAYGALVCLGKGLAPVLLLALRLYFGWHLFLTGVGKMMHFSDTVTYFTTLNIPVPDLAVALVAIIECAGGLLLVVGLISRLASLFVICVMAGAYWFAHHESLVAFTTNPDLFFAQPPLHFLLTALIVLCFGPGLFSVDQIVEWRLCKKYHKACCGGGSCSPKEHPKDHSEHGQ